MNKLLILFFIVPFSSFGQNLVPNGSFEDTISCPNALNQLNKANFWINPTLGTPDLLHTCSIWPGIAAFGYQQPHSGSAYAAFFPGNPISQTREYIETPLLVSLINGECYQLSFYANLGHFKYTTDAFQAYFSDTLIDSVPSSKVLNLNPQISNHMGNYLDTLSWTFVQGEFQAIGGENYLIIGNFDSSAYCNWVIVDSNATNNGCQILIDDITLIQLTCTGLAEIIPFEFDIYPVPAFDFINISSKSDLMFEIKLFNGLSKLQTGKYFIGETKFDIRKLSSGFYYYQIFYKSTPVKFGKFFKLK